MEESQKAKVSLGLVQTQRTLLRQELRAVWNERLRGPLAFAPSELREKISEAALRDENDKFGKFASAFLKAELFPILLHDIQRRIGDHKLIVGVGYGKGFDSKWLFEAALAGLTTCWVDVSDVACEWARNDLDTQWAQVARPLVGGPVVVEGELGELLSTEPDPGLDQEKVEIWYLCRLLGCLKEDRAPLVLELLGRSHNSLIDLNGCHKTVVVSAFKEDNPHRVGVTSRLYERKMVLEHLERGAERKVMVTREATHLYFDQVYTALTIQAVIGEER